MSLVVIFGPQAVGKMTVGQELCKLTGYKLFHNHMVIDMVGSIFDPEHIGEIWEMKYTHYNLISSIWETVLEFSAENNENLVFTLTWDFENKNIEYYMEELEQRYNVHGQEVYFVELEANVQTRLARNGTDNRISNKVCKRNIVKSNHELVYESDEFRLNSMPGELTFKNYIKIDNSNLSVEETAKIVTKTFNL